MALCGTCPATSSTMETNISSAAICRMATGGDHSCGLSQRILLNP